MPIFDPKVITAIVQSSVGLPLEEAMDKITRELDAKYPGHIYTKPRRWVYNNAGGAMGQMTLLHGSLSEYIIFFGTPIGTEGHSGRYFNDVHDIMIEGDMWCYYEGELGRAEYKAGDYAHLTRFRSKGYKIPSHGYMVEYARGPIPLMLPFGLADTLFSTLDIKTLFRTLWYYGQLVIGQLFRGKI